MGINQYIGGIVTFSNNMEGIWGSIVADKQQNGRNGGIRTRDPYTPSVVRYQAALRSDDGTITCTNMKGKLEFTPFYCKKFWIDSE